MMSFAAGPAPMAAFGGVGLAPDLPGGHHHSQHYFDGNETRPAADREQELMARLPNLVRSAKVAKGWAWMLSELREPRRSSPARRWRSSRCCAGATLP